MEPKKTKEKGKKNRFLVLDFLIGLKTNVIFLTGKPKGPSLLHRQPLNSRGSKTQEEQLKSSLTPLCGNNPHSHGYGDGLMCVFPFGTQGLQRSYLSRDSFVFTLGFEKLEFKGTGVLTGFKASPCEHSPG